MLSQTGTGQLSGTSFLGVGGASGKGGCIAVGLGTTGLNVLGTALFLFSAALSFLMLGLVLGSGGLNWLAGAWVGPILPSTSRKVFISLMIVGWGAKSCVPWCALDYLCCPVSSKYMGSLHGHDLHFHIHHLYREFAPEETVQEVILSLK